MKFPPETFFGFLPPLTTPKLFAPLLLGSVHHEHSAPSFSLDGSLILWSRWRRPDEDQPQCIMQMEYLEGEWQSPSIAPFSGTWNDGSPVFDFQGKFVYFYSTRPSKERHPQRNNLWRVAKTSNGWGTPEKLPFPLSTDKIQVAEMVEKFNDFELSPIHFMDVVEDMLP